MPGLITAGLYPEAYRLQRILSFEDVFFADEKELPLMRGIKSMVLPSYTSPSFAHEILKACLDNDINMIYPLKQGEIVELSRTRQLFTEYNIGLMIPSDDWLKNNLTNPSFRHSNIAVLQNGELLAGSLPESQFISLKETGIFTWAAICGKIEYCLYLRY
ncbi:MAG: hypothetical protein ACYCZO_12375 [Daejeonella sp.]